MVGLGVAWRLAGLGRRVTLLERGRTGRGATHAAAGMLSPALEIGFEELDLYALSRESLRRWPAFARALERAAGRSVGYRDEGALDVATDRDEAAALRRRFRFQQAHGVPVEWLAGDAAQELEPLLAPGLPGAVFAPGDHQVDNRALAAALAEAARRAGVRILEDAPVAAVLPREAGPAVRLASGDTLGARAVVLAAGAWSRGVEGLAPAAPPVRPLKGQMLALRMAAPLALRLVVRSPEAYLVPKADGRLVVGATSEEQGFDTRVTAGGLYRLLEGAVRVVPAVEELELAETWAGLRPASRDHAPILGRSAHPGVVYATGHYRHGILLAPVTADEVAADVHALLDGHPPPSDALAPFSPRRFGGARAAGAPGSA